MSAADAMGFNTGQAISTDLDRVAHGRWAETMSDAGAETGFTTFFRAEFARVVRTVFLILHDRGRAEEVAQEAFVQLLGHWAKVSRYDQPDAWVRRVAIRLAGRAASRERMRGLLEARFRPAVAAPPGEPTGEVAEAVRRLPYGQRAAIVLFYFEDRPVAEIADLLGCTAATVRVHLHKARHRLATLLHEEVDDVV